MSSPDFADSGCTKPVASYRTDSQATCNAPPTAARDRMFYEIGAKAKAVFRGAPGSCRTITSDGDHYEVGAALPLSALPVLSTQDVGSGRIQLRTLVTESGSRVQVSTMFDSVKRLPCNPMMATDGKIRCLPSQVPSISTFSDAACTKPILEHYPGSAPVANGDLGLARMGVDSYAAVVLSSTIPRPAIFYYGNPGNCTTLTPTAGTTFYSTTLVPATEFAPVTRVVE